MKRITIQDADKLGTGEYRFIIQPIGKEYRGWIWGLDYIGDYEVMRIAPKEDLLRGTLNFKTASKPLLLKEGQWLEYEEVV